MLPLVYSKGRVSADFAVYLLLSSNMGLWTDEKLEFTIKQRNLDSVFI